jgi:hypothetical protein
MFYSDYFNDYLDYTVKPGISSKYTELKAELYAIAKKSRKFGYLFNTAAKLCEVLEIKYELGIKTRRAYESGDKNTLKSLAENDYKILSKRLREFGDVFEKQWFYDNKPCGFDVQDLRIGGITRRTDACRKRILDYVSGKIDSIQELEEKLIPLPNAEAETPTYIMKSANIFTSNVIE